MSRHSRWFQASILVVVTVLAWCQPQAASAWHGRWHHGFYGGGFRPWCGPVFGPRVYGGWGGWYGGTRFAFRDAVALGGPFGGSFSGAVSSYVIGPRWCGPAAFGGWGGYRWGGCYGFPCTYYPYPIGYGGWGYAPIVVSPFGGSIAPVYGPAGVLPFMGLSSATPIPSSLQTLAARGPAMTPMARLAARSAAAGSPVAPPVPQLALGTARQVAPLSSIAVRASNGEARLRAARLVAVGDRHLRTAVQAPAKLAAALDAYKRAATIAPDQADTFLRQAIVLTALERTDDAAKAVDRAVAIDGRLGGNAAAAVAAQERLPPDPVFGDRPDIGPTTLASRTTGLLDRIFPGSAGDGPAVPAGANWIAARWSRQWQGQVNAVAAR